MPTWAGRCRILFVVFVCLASHVIRPGWFRCMAVVGSRIALLGVGRITKFHFLDMNNPGSRSGVAFHFIVYGPQLPDNLERALIEGTPFLVLPWDAFWNEDPHARSRGIAGRPGPYVISIFSSTNGVAGVFSRAVESGAEIVQQGRSKRVLLVSRVRRVAVEQVGW